MNVAQIDWEMALQGPVKVAKKLKIVVSEPIVLLKLKNYTKWFGCLCQKFENALRVVEGGAKLESPPRGAQTVQQLLKFGQKKPKWPKIDMSPFIWKKCKTNENLVMKHFFLLFG